MLALAAPGYLLAALAASAAVVALHLLGWRRPPAVALPTARFVPHAAVRAVSRQVRPSDLLLLALRVAALLLTGLAMARPAMAPRRAGVARVIVVDASRRVASMTEAMDSARAHVGAARTISWIRVDSSARVVTDSAIGERGEGRGRLGSGMVAAIREAHRLARTHERVAIVIVSPFAAESWDAGVEAMRGSWDGEVVPVRVPVRVTERVAVRDGRAEPGREMGEEAPFREPPVAARARTASFAAGGTPAARELPPVGDPIGVAFARALDASAPPVRVRRSAASASDSAWAREGGIVVSWPEERGDDAAALPLETAGTTSAPDDATGAPDAVLTTGSVTAAGHFRRSRVALPTGTTILRWGDGAPAATEAALGRGCIRTVGVTVSTVGDLVLRPAFLRLVREVAGVCGGGSDTVVDDVTLARWAMGATADSLTPPSQAGGRDGRGAERAVPAGEETLPRALLAAAALVLLMEWVVRRRRGDREGVAPRDAGATLLGGA